MSKSAKKPPAEQSTTGPKSSVGDRQSHESKPGSKQSRVIAMLQSPAGTTITAMMKATDWQQHSVRGFLAGVVRKRLKLKLRSEKVDGERVYRILSPSSGKPRQAKQRPS